MTTTRVLIKSHQQTQKLVLSTFENKFENYFLATQAEYVNLTV